MTKEETIQGYMKSLDLTREEAEQLYADDMNDYISEEGEEMTKKANRMKNYIPTEKNKKKRTVKKDPEKITIIKTLYDFLWTYYPDAEIVNPQREITFKDYSITLIKHRKKK